MDWLFRFGVTGALAALLCAGNVTRAQEGAVDQEVREIQEPAPEGVELDLTNPDVTEADVEWKDSPDGGRQDDAGLPDEDVAESESQHEEEPRETFGDRFRRGELFGVFDVQGRFFPQSAAPQNGNPPANNYWFNGSIAWEPGFFMHITDNMNFELILFGLLSLIHI